MIIYFEIYDALRHWCGKCVRFARCCVSIQITAFTQGNVITLFSVDAQCMLQNNCIVCPYCTYIDIHASHLLTHYYWNPRLSYWAVICTVSIWCLYLDVGCVPWRLYCFTVTLHDRHCVSRQWQSNCNSQSLFRTRTKTPMLPCRFLSQRSPAKRKTYSFHGII